MVTELIHVKHLLMKQCLSHRTCANVKLLKLLVTGSREMLEVWNVTDRIRCVH